MKILMTWHWRSVTRMFENIVRIYKRVTYPFKRVLSMMICTCCDRVRVQVNC